MAVSESAIQQRLQTTVLHKRGTHLRDDGAADAPTAGSDVVFRQSLASARGGWRECGVADCRINDALRARRPLPGHEQAGECGEEENRHRDEHCRDHRADVTVHEYIVRQQLDLGGELRRQAGRQLRAGLARPYLEPEACGLGEAIDEGLLDLRRQPSGACDRLVMERHREQCL
jgi:hypothetical protein